MSPKTGFVIMRDDELSSTRRRSLDLLYQPILHPTAYTLVNLLWQLGELSANPLFKRPIHDLLAYLNVDIKVFQIALHRVEGAGLVRTFYKRDVDHPFYIFHLIQPVSARTFFKNDLLSVGLLEIIGDQRFVNLSHDLIPKPYRFKNVHDLSRDFLEVYNVGHNNITDIPKLIRKIRSGISAKMSSSLKKDHDYIDQAPDFSFKLLMNIIKNDSYSNPQEVKAHRHLIMTEHTLYGLDEYAIANYISQATSVVNNQVDFDKFKWLIAKAFQGNPGIPPKTHFKVKSGQDLQQSRKVSNEERGLIRAADYYSPVQFLHHLKKRLNPHAIVTHQEEYTLRQLIDDYAFRDNRGVINILTYYVIVEKQMPALKSSYMQYIVAAWGKAGVNTPSDALAAIAQFNQKITKRKRKKLKRLQGNHSRRYNYGHRRPVIKQKLPKWAKTKYNAKLHPANPKLIRKVEEHVKELNSRKPRNGKGGNK